MLLLPWIVQQSVELLIGAGLFIVYAIAGANFSVVQIIGYCFTVVCASYFCYAVLSHYISMRRMSKNAAQVVSSVMNG